MHETERQIILPRIGTRHHTPARSCWYGAITHDSRSQEMSPSLHGPLIPPTRPTIGWICINSVPRALTKGDSGCNAYRTNHSSSRCQELLCPTKEAASSPKRRGNSRLVWELLCDVCRKHPSTPPSRSLNAIPGHAMHGTFIRS